MEGTANSRLLYASFVCLTATAGCCLCRSHPVWRLPEFVDPITCGAANHDPLSAEAAYALAAQAEESGEPSCVDFYYLAAVRAASALELQLASGVTPAPRLVELDYSAVAKLLITAQQYGRWNPSQGLTVWSTGGPSIVPMQFHGFEWAPNEFQFMTPVGYYRNPLLSRRFRNDGFGAPLVVVRCTARPQPFTQAQQTFAATAVVRPGNGPSGGRLELYDPLRAPDLCVAGQPVALARDLSAPFAYAKQTIDRTWITNFFRPGTAGSRDGLFMIEPHQHGKIPVVFIHGLLSDPETWIDLVNELRARPGLNDRYQWWGFRYATGEPFLESAAILRRQLAQIRGVYDPTRSDPALSQMVLIGHSLGGLVAKLQVTESGDRLWSSVATQPLWSLRTNPTVRQSLQEAFFFQPSSDVKRVIFIGTPHLGSKWARRPVGRLGSALVEPAPQTEARFQQLMRDNPCVLCFGNTDRFPTSIDLLEPTNPLLVATAALPFTPCVTLHSIIGVARTTWSGEPSDGVVTVSSARLCGVATERFVDEVHTRLHRNRDSVDEIECILRAHLRANSPWQESAAEDSERAALRTSQRETHLRWQSAAVVTPRGSCWADSDK